MSMNDDTEIAKTRRDIANMLRKPPSKGSIRERNGRKYIPISFIEADLDLIFGPFGYQWRNYQHNTIVNEEVGSIELWIRDPESGEWIARVGAAAAMITLKQGSTAVDVQSKQMNAMETSFPHLKSDCKRNACQELGKRFGRDLARKLADVETYTDAIASYGESFRSAIASLNSAEDVKIAWNTLKPEMRQFDDIIEIYKTKMRDLERMHLKGGDAQ
jgi:hypothetical protein